ncbi:MAG: hypothetical protein J4478_03935 [Candidatus Diapherotrites archaeon]|uniref:Uncharacterized protein n=1 Tax=Candidatus Iainarchaeum sp. TaxID=3101447 RepID=A0A8T4KTZ9_9ARCH|nr:hypothetical protein [Candidatus Diapherotrites archaeon]
MLSGFGNFAGKKGVLLSFTALLLILALLSLIDALNTQSSRANASQALVFALQSASSKFENLYTDIVFLDKEPAAKIVDERNLPFSYSLDYNSVQVIQELPLKQNVWDSYFDLLNSFKIFNESPDFEISDGFAISVQTVQNSKWGGSAQDMNFLLLPQCLQYSALSNLSQAGFYPASSVECPSSGFDASKIKKYSISIRVKKTSLEDYNAISYNIAGFSNPAFPEFEFNFIDSNCSQCAVPTASKHIEGYFDPSQQSSIRIYCSGSGCNSQDINISIGNGIQAFHSGSYRIDANFSLIFKNPISAFYFTDFNVSVQNQDFNITYANS